MAAFSWRLPFYSRFYRVAHFATTPAHFSRPKPYRIGVLTAQKSVHGALLEKRASPQSIIDDLFLRKFVAGTLSVHNMLVKWFPIVIHRRNDRIVVVAGVKRSAAVSSLTRLWWLKGYVETLESKRTGRKVTLELKIV
ncbi:small ribosomal subunit protein uS3m-like [Oscarella lobularis]|uniref:small ribosomal subunit protein uS3m-like n=1 Tax=Oscarella lobularis TaxID=121494 RepID=UPI00331433F4